MKKIILAFFATGIIVTTAHAQIAIAPEAGLNFANLKYSGTNSMSSSARTSIALGGTIDYAYKKIFFQSGLFYEGTGAKYSDDNGGTGTDKINTLKIPINVQYKLGTEKMNRFFFGAGIYFGYNLSGKSDDGGQTTSLNFGNTSGGATSGGDDFKKLDIGLGLNVGYQLVKGWYARIHYQFGIKNMDPDAGNDGSSIKTSAIGITAGYYLKLKMMHKGTGMKNTSSQGN